MLITHPYTPVRLRCKALKVLGDSLPATARRMILLATISVSLAGGKKHFDAATLDKLNVAMQLSNRADALLLPIQFTNLIWKKQVIAGMALQAKQGSLDEEHFIDRLMDNVPAWLMYCSPASLREDLVKLIRAQSVIFA